MLTRKTFVSRLSAAAVILALGPGLLAGCSDPKREIKDVKSLVQVKFGEKKYKEALVNAEKGLKLALANIGPKHPDTLYFAQAISEGYTQLGDKKNALGALNREIDMRSAAGQSEEKLQLRRTTAIKYAEEIGDRGAAAKHAVAVAKAIDMGPGKDPQPVYRTETKYPPQQFNRGVEGDVVVRYSLDANGSVLDASVVRGTPADVFDSAALDSFKKWRFTPMLNNGAPVPVNDLQFTIMFRLGGVQGQAGAAPAADKGRAKKK